MTPLIKKIIIWGLIVVVVGGGALGYWFYKTQEAKVEYTTAEVKKGTLIQSISATGSVEPPSEIDLNFKTSGELEEVNIKVGDEVKEGDILAVLEARDLEIKVQQARAELLAAEANLNQKLAGETPEAVYVSEVDVEQAKVALEKAEKDLENAKINLDNTKITTARDIENAELAVTAAADTLDSEEKDLNNTKATNDQAIADAYNNTITTMESNLVTMSTALTDMDNILGIDNKTANDAFENHLGVLNPQSKIDAEDSYRDARDAKNQVETAVDNLSSDSSNSLIDSTILDVKNALNLTSSALAKVKIMLDNSITSADFTLTDLNSKKTTVDTDRTSINTASNSLETKEQNIISAKLTANSSNDTAQAAYDAAKNSYDQTKQQLETVRATVESKIASAEAEVDTAEMQIKVQQAALDYAEAALQLKKALPREVDIAAFRAQVEQARAALALAENQLNDVQIKAPISGIITVVNFEIGEQTSLTQPVASMLAADEFQIEVDISEADIAKVKINDSAKITFDAFGEDKIFAGKVIFIDPAETIIADVVYYKVTIGLDRTEEEIKSGMTANVNILTAQKENVLFIPQRAIIEKNGDRIVRILEKKKIREVKVAIGLRGDDGLVEIISGVEEGQEVVTYVKEKK